MVPESLTLAIEILFRSRRAGGAAGKIIKEILPLLERAEQELQSAGAPVRRLSKRSDAGVEYVVEKVTQGEVLTERRMSGRSAPFRCPKSIYDAVGAAILGADQAIALDQIALSVEKRLSYRVGEFQLRVPLRLWMHVKPPLIVRHRARYQPVDPKSFSLAAQQLWHRLASPAR